MPLPININELINGLTVEWERIEFKEAWNPEAVIHSMCAFANDINNWGGGYIVIGIGENDGRPVFPPAGLDTSQLDAYQKKLIELCHLITPHYFPVAVPYVLQEKHILILWCPGGDTRPYKAPKYLGRKSESVYYIRRFSSTVRANNSEDEKLFHLAAKLPFDDRINHHADVADLNITLIKSFLKEVGSKLYKTADDVSFKELCLQMHIARGPPEYIRPVNSGLLFFNEEPETFFRGTRIEIVEFHDEIGDSFSERIFTGPLNIQLQDALHYIKNNVLKEEIRKLPDEAKAHRFFNYPYIALEEALANAVYHKSYERQNPIEVNIRSDRIEILSFPGPVPPITKDQLKKPYVVTRDYRNRRIGDFLKELHMTEGRNTGIPKIRRAMKFNGSPEPIFETDDDLNYFLTVLKIHPEAYDSAAKGIDEQIDEKPPINEKQRDILLFCTEPHSRREIFDQVGLKNTYHNHKKQVLPLLENGHLSFTTPEKPQSRYQKYVLTEKGKVFLKSLK